MKIETNMMGISSPLDLTKDMVTPGGHRLIPIGNTFLVNGPGNLEWEFRIRPPSPRKDNQRCYKQECIVRILRLRFDKIMQILILNAGSLAKSKVLN